MTDKELRKLSRAELLELLLERCQEVERLQEQLQQAEERLASRELIIENAGSIAQAALQVNGVFEAAQQAADQYLQNVEAQCRRRTEACIRLEAETKARCRRLLSQAREQAHAIQAEEQSCGNAEAEQTES